LLNSRFLLPSICVLFDFLYCWYCVCLISFLLICLLDFFPSYLSSFLLFASFSWTPFRLLWCRESGDRFCVRLLRHFSVLISPLFETHPPLFFHCFRMSEFLSRRVFPPFISSWSFPIVSLMRSNLSVEVHIWSVWSFTCLLSIIWMWWWNKCCVWSLTWSS
jgi:hypothetical protein